MFAGGRYRVLVAGFILPPRRCNFLAALKPPWKRSLEAGSAEARQEGGANKGCGGGAAPAGGAVARQAAEAQKKTPSGFLLLNAV